MKRFNVPFTKRTYKEFEIHSVTKGIWKYDIYKHGLYFSSVNSLRDAKQYITSVIWTRENVPF